MTTRTRNKPLVHHKECNLNLKCCSKHPDLQYSDAFHPPLLGAPSEFCTHALAKGVPIQNCAIFRPETLEITVIPDPVPIHPYLLNWYKWCRIWKQNQQYLATIRKGCKNPPLLTACTEAECQEKEDVKLFQRSLENINAHVPEVLVTRFSKETPTGKVFEEKHPPILHVVGCRTDIQLTYAASANIPSYSDQIPPNQNFFIEELDTFYATTRGKDTRHITLKNEGATAIRYQWLRFPPTKEMTNLLKNHSKVFENMAFFANNTIHPRGSGSDEVHKACNLEFRCRELPGVILTGQKIDFPIIFRTKKPGYYHETLYLVTHPQLQDPHGRTYAVRMTGICVDPELTDVKEEPISIQTIKDAVKEMITEQGATDAVTAIIDSAIFRQNEFVHSTLPFGKVTSESLFYAHNKIFTYHYGVAEKTLDLVRKILELLVPKESLVLNDTVCQLSIQRLYRLLLDPHVSSNLYMTHFKSDHAENLLKTLAEHTNLLLQPRRFTYPSKDERIKVACSAASVALVQEIVNSMAQVDELFERPAVKMIIQSLNDPPITAPSPTITPKSPRPLEVSIKESEDTSSAKESDNTGTPFTEASEPTTDNATETTEIININPTEGNPESHALPTLPEGNNDYLELNKKTKIAQAKRIVIEDLLGSAIDRIVCIVDAVKAAEDYKPSNFMVNPNLSCCDQPLV